MPPRTPGPTNSFGRFFTAEVTGFLSGRLGELIFQKAPQSVIDKVISFLPDGVLDTPDKQKNFAFYASLLAGGISRNPLAFSAFEKFMAESLEELGNRRGEYVGNDAKRKTLLHEIFNKRVALVDGLKTPTAVPASGLNLPDAVARCTKHKQREFYDDINNLPLANRQYIMERWNGIIVSEERAMSIIDAPPALRYTLLKDLVEHAPKNTVPKTRISVVLDKIGEIGNEWIDPKGPNMTGFAANRVLGAQKTEAQVRLRNRIFGNRGVSSPRSDGPGRVSKIASKCLNWLFRP